VPVSPSYEELVELVARQAELLEQQRKEIERLTARVAELEARLRQNSQNSSKPPSTDPPENQPVRGPARRRSGRKRGKQPGAEGKTLRQVEDPEHVVDHLPGECAGCGAGLSTAPVVADPVRRQVFDLPQIRPVVTEHRMHRKACACGTVTTALAPDGVRAPACYGPNLSALAAYLVVFQHLPIERAAALLSDVCGTGVSTGWVSNVIGRVAGLLTDIEDLIKTLLTLVHVLHVDETSVNINGDKQWLHVASTADFTAYHLHRSRGREAIDGFGILGEFQGVAVHDCWAAYHGYDNCVHAFCGAHILRELTAAAETHLDQDWPTAAIEALTDLNTAAHAARARNRRKIPAKITEPLLDKWKHALLCGLAAHPAALGRKQSKTRNLLERLNNNDEQVLRFARDLTVPFTNNQAERDLRPAKTQMKISGCHRSEHRARDWLRIRGYISTARKQGVHILTALRDAVNGNPWKPATPTT
jgi:transposase